MNQADLQNPRTDESNCEPWATSFRDNPEVVSDDALPKIIEAPRENNLSAARQFLVWTEGDTTFHVAIAHVTHVVFTNARADEEKILKLFIAGSGQEVHTLMGQTAITVYEQLAVASDRE